MTSLGVLVATSGLLPFLVTFFSLGGGLGSDSPFCTQPREKGRGFVFFHMDIRWASECLGWQSLGAERGRVLQSAVAQLGSPGISALSPFFGGRVSLLK